MEPNPHAVALGRMGGRARARSITRRRRQEIAAMGGLSRSLSRHAARRIRENFEYLAAVEVLRKAGARDAR